MQPSTYGDIIEDKLLEWQSEIAKLEQHAQKAGSETFSGKIDRLRAAITDAGKQLKELDDQENASNTIEIKSKILEVFTSIDREIKSHVATTPYML